MIKLKHYAVASFIFATLVLTSCNSSDEPVHDSTNIQVTTSVSDSSVTQAVSVLFTGTETSVSSSESSVTAFSQSESINIVTDSVTESSEAVANDEKEQLPENTEPRNDNNSGIIQTAIRQEEKVPVTEQPSANPEESSDIKVNEAGELVLPEIYF